MNIVEILREKRLELKAANLALVKKLEPQIVEFQEAVNQRIYLPINNRFGSQFHWGEEAHPLPDNIRPNVVALYNHLLPLEGTVIHQGASFCVDQALINEFSSMTGDRQWIHMDPILARKKSPFRAPVAQGLLILSILPKLGDFDNYQKKLYPGARYIINRGFENVEFLHPVKVDSSIYCQTILKKVVPGKRHLDIAQTMEVQLEGSGELACRADVLFRVFT